MNPAPVIGGEPAGWDHAMDMGMNPEILSPGMQDAEESDLGAEMFGIGSDLQQSRGAGAEQKVIDDLLVLQRQPREFVRDRKNNMHVLHGQQFFAAFGNPLVASIGLALGTMPGAARVERGGLKAALATAIQVATECRRAAVLDGEKDAQMEPSQPGSVPFDEAAAMHPDNICHLERWPAHFLCSLRDRFTWSGLESSALSSGVPAAFRWRSDR